MGLEHDLIEGACGEFWNQYHERVEEEGYTLGKKSFFYGEKPGDFTLFAAIGNKCPEKMLKRFRKEMPMTFSYSKDGVSRTYNVAVGPSMDDIPKFYD